MTQLETLRLVSRHLGEVEGQGCSAADVLFAELLIRERDKSCRLVTRLREIANYLDDGCHPGMAEAVRWAIATLKEMGPPDV